MSETACEQLFEAMVESVGPKAFAAEMSLSTRQIHRMLNGAQPNPISRFCDAIAATGLHETEAAVDFICKRQGGYFVRRPDGLHSANLNAVKESAEAIVAITEGRSPTITVKEIREAIEALAALEHLLDKQQS